ncbi:unnamed protein product [Blepharisma stoltei]|uniref:LNR domain-containing protein n=1 Tax=Blepharisma stoltei TaxID=1481888 RepID=A0AAU9I682_9CILI|nr:unnamed protein product [Blepharisma stoltei]
MHLLSFLLLSISNLSASSVTLTCNLNWCPSSWLGDGYCDFNCMNSYCGYDIDPKWNSDDPSYSDCYNDCVYTDGCNPDLLGDGKCDSSCNTWRCGYDWGDCGYCTGSCYQVLLGTGTCESKCNVAECYYNIGTCQECSNGCGAALLGDGNCDSECNNADCNYDFGDCADVQCAPGCYTWMINDWICNDACHVEACGWDSYDCDCSPGCLESMLGNGQCDSLCNNWNCYLDDWDCGYCAESCYENMLGDLVCNPECNNIDCYYDYSDCGCADGCTLADYGQCKPECLVADCYYDQISSDPSQRCQDEGLVKFALYQSLSWWWDFSRTPIMSICNNESSGTCDSVLATDPTTCHPECDYNTCGFSFGNCSPETELTCTYDCASCYGEVEWACLRCEDYAVQYYGYCFSSCPGDMEARTVLSSNPICFPIIDISSLKNPQVYYATSVKTYNPTGGAGTLESPFETLAVALAFVRKKYCVIYLLNDGDYELSATDSAYNVYGTLKYPDYPLYQDGSLYTLYLKITSYDGNLIRIKRVPGQDLMLQFINSGLTLEMENIIIDGSEVDSSCSGAFCNYCPYIEQQLDGSFKDDRGNPISEYIDQTECQKWETTVLFDVEGGTLNLTNVSFQNWRMQFQSLIFSRSGQVYLSNVDFDNIVSARTEAAAVVEFESCDDPTYQCGSFSYKSGTVSRLNNGYEFLDPVDFRGFFYAGKVNSVFIQDVIFTKNVVTLKTDSSLSTASLITLKIFRTFELDSCTFYMNVAENGLINIQAKGLVYRTELNSQKEVKDLLIDHINIHDSNFTQNWGSSAGILSASYQGELQNIKIANSFFKLNGVQSGSLVYISNNNIKQEFKIDTVKPVTLPSGQRDTGTYRARSLSISGLTFLNNFSGDSGMVSLTKLVNMVIKDMELSSNGGSESVKEDINTLVLDNLIADPDIYMKARSSAATIVDCASLMAVSGSDNATIENATLANNYCGSSSPTFIIENSANVTIVSANCTENIGNGANAACFTISGPYNVSIFNSSFTLNHNFLASSPGALQVSRTLQNLTLSNCYFAKNKADYGGALQFLGQFLFLNNCTFDYNESPSESGGAIYYSPVLTTKYIGFHANSVNFTNNYADVHGGSVYMLETLSGKVQVDFLMTECYFYNNSAATGSAVYLDSTIALSQSSKIKDSFFKSNTASTSGALSALFLNGILTISSTNFYKNHAKLGAALYVNINEDQQNLKSEVILSLCNFTYNLGESVIYLDDSSQYSYMETSQCRFEYNLGSAVELNYDYWKEAGSIFQYNFASAGGSAVRLKNEALAVSDASIYYNNTSSRAGGVIAISSSSLFECNSCNFTANYAGTSGGVVFAEQSSEFVIKDSVFTRNSCANKGSIMYLLGSSSPVSQLSSSNIYGNTANGEGAIVLLDSSISINSSSIHDNTADSATPGLLLTLSSANVSDCEFYSQTGKQGSFIYASTQSAVQLSNTTLKYGTSSGSGGAVFAISSTVVSTNSTFQHLSANSGGAILAYSDSTVTIATTKFINCTTVGTGAVIDTFQSSVSIHHSIFTNFSYTAIYGDKLYQLSITDAAFTYGFGIYGGALYCSTCTGIYIKSCLFAFNNATIGGALYMTTQSDSIIDTPYYIDKSIFTNNSASKGGAFYTNNVMVNITNSDFKYNQALASGSTIVGGVIEYGIGGGFVLECTDLSICEFNITNNSFTGNVASYNGGAYSWSDIMPLVESNTFINNSAPYAADVSSFPVSLVSVDDSGKPQEYTRLLYSPVTQVLSDIASGQIASTPIKIALVDHNNQVIKTDNSSQAELIALDGSTSLSGETKVTAIEGVFYFDSFIVTSIPGSSIQIKVYTSAIDTSKSSKAKDQITYHENIYVNITLRECKVGEATVGNTCESCPSNFYSLDPSNTACIICPSCCICYGNYTIVPRKGYWRDNMYAKTFWECPNSDACLGSPLPPNISYTGVCADGYKGNMCQSCDWGYSRTAENTCSPCPDKVSNTFRIFGILVALVALCAIMVKSTRNSAFKPKSLTSVYIKIFMNYLQLVMLVSTFNLNWPSQVIAIFSVQNNAGSVSEQFFSFDCFLQAGGSPDQVYYNKLIFMSLLPILVAILCLLAWCLIKCKKRNFRNLWNDYVSTCIILLFLLHPNIVKTMFGSFNCKQINDGEYWLVSNMDIRCWNSNHIFYILLVALPSIIVWGIGIPAICLMGLMKNRRNLNDLGVRLKFGFFFNGYSGKCYYWEFVILYRKILVICCSVFLTNISTSIQALTVTILLIACLHLQYTHQPYNGTQLNRMELRSILVSSITIYCGLYFLTESLSSEAKLFFFWIIVLANIYFLYYWVNKMFGAGCQIISNKIPCLRKRFSRRVNDLLEDKIFENNEGMQHVKVKDGDKFFSLIYGDGENSLKVQPFQPELTMKDWFLHMVEDQNKLGTDQNRGSGVANTMVVDSNNVSIETLDDFTETGRVVFPLRHHKSSPRL